MNEQASRQNGRDVRLGVGVMLLITGKETDIRTQRNQNGLNFI